jgi:tetratricopeptide (TPR) repeat protein
MAHAASEHRVEWRALRDLGRLWASRDHNQARDYFEAALKLARRIDEPAVLADSLNWMGNWHTNDDNFERAVAYHTEALTIFENLGDRRGLANTLDLLGMANMLADDLAASVQYYDRAIPLFRELDDRPRLVSSLTGRANSCSMLVFLASVSATLTGDATLDLNEALRIAREIDSAPDQAWAHLGLGMLHTVHGHFGCALQNMQNGLRIASEIGHREFVVGNGFGLGILYAELFAPDQARGQLEAALALAAELRSPALIHRASGALAGAYLMLDDLKSAQACLEKVISPQTPMDTGGKRYCWVRQAELALAQDDPALALNITERLIASAPGMSPGRVITFLWMLKAEASAAMGRTDEAESLLRAALENARAVGERFLLWRVHTSLGRLYRAMDRKREAEEAFSAARELVQELAATIPDEALKDNFLQGAVGALGTPASASPTGDNPPLRSGQGVAGLRSSAP